jgi:hypothetical protein
MARALTLEPDQVRWFRARQTGLAQSLADLASAARASVGIQSQQLAPSLWGLAQRTDGCPSAAEVQAALFEEPRSLIRTWGNRGTIHLYATDHWRKVIAAKPVWGVDMPRAVLPPDEVVDQARQIVEATDEPVTRSEVMHLVKGRFLRELKDYIGDAMDPKRLGAGRLLWKMTATGELCFATKRGAEQAYAQRQHWHPQLTWPRVAGGRAAIDLARAYLRHCGPASVQDMAHFFGARVTEARKWEAALREAGELIDVKVATEAGREHVALAESEAGLREAVPSSQKDWPIRLLPLWDGLLMSHADKSWTVPVEAERALIWKKAAMVAPVVLARGQAVATWQHKARAKCVDVTITPLSGWRKSRHLDGATRAAQAFAAHLGRPEAQVTVAN